MKPLISAVVLLFVLHNSALYLFAHAQRLSTLVRVRERCESAPNLLTLG